MNRCPDVRSGSTGGGTHEPRQRLESGQLVASGEVLGGTMMRVHIAARNGSPNPEIDVRLKALACAIAAFAAMALPASAQVSLSPNIGVYIPTAELARAAAGEEFKQEISLLVGGRLGIGFGQRVGLTVTADYSPSELRFNAGGSEARTPGNILTGSGRLSFNVLPPASPVLLMLHGGASVIRRGGEAFEDQVDRTDVGGVAGATVGFRLGSLLSFYVNADDYIYRASFEGGAATEQVTQHDIHLSVGLGVPLGASQPR